SPAIRVTLPLTMPPPNTKSISLMPVCMRLKVSALATAPIASVCNRCPPFDTVSLVIANSSCRVFHEPQTAQRPAQAELIAPQFVHTYLTDVFAIISPAYYKYVPQSLSQTDLKAESLRLKASALMLRRILWYSPPNT